MLQAMAMFSMQSGGADKKEPKSKKEKAKHKKEKKRKRSSKRKDSDSDSGSDSSECAAHRCCEPPQKTFQPETTSLPCYARERPCVRHWAVCECSWLGHPI
jgi:hypothetical protein